VKRLRKQNVKGLPKIHMPLLENINYIDNPDSSDDSSVQTCPISTRSFSKPDPFYVSESPESANIHVCNSSRSKADVTSSISSKSAWPTVENGSLKLQTVSQSACSSTVQKKPTSIQTPLTNLVLLQRQMHQMY
jgi:hypothetical protein